VPRPFFFAAQPWADYGFTLEEGQGHLGLARRLITLSEPQVATEPLKKARAMPTPRSRGSDEVA